jgi:hypothetical protein
MLNTFLPLPFIVATIAPIHFSVTVSHIVEIMPFVYISCCPRKNPIPRFPIICVLSFIFI